MPSPIWPRRGIACSSTVMVFRFARIATCLSGTNSSRQHFQSGKAAFGKVSPLCPSDRSGGHCGRSPGSAQVTSTSEGCARITRLSGFLILMRAPDWTRTKHVFFSNLAATRSSNPGKARFANCSSAMVRWSCKSQHNQSMPNSCSRGRKRIPRPELLLMPVWIRPRRRAGVIQFFHLLGRQLPADGL